MFVDPGFLNGAIFKLNVLSRTELLNLLPAVVIPSVFCNQRVSVLNCIVVCYFK